MLSPDHRPAERVHPPEESGGVPRPVHRDGADGRQPLPGDQHGPGPREDVLPALPDALRDQAPASGGNHTQGEQVLLQCFRPVSVRVDWGLAKVH